MSVFDTYLNPDALRRPRVAVSGKRVSTSAPLADTAFEYSTKEINQAVADKLRKDGAHFGGGCPRRGRPRRRRGRPLADGLRAAAR